MTNQEIDKKFSYHPPCGNQQMRYEVIRGTAKQFARTLSRLCPMSPEFDVAMQKLQETVMFANAAIAINENPLDERQTFRGADGPKHDFV